MTPDAAAPRPLGEPLDNDDQLSDLISDLRDAESVNYAGFYSASNKERRAARLALVAYVETKVAAEREAARREGPTREHATRVISAAVEAARREAIRECIEWAKVERRDDGTAQRIEAHLRALLDRPAAPEVTDDK